MTSLELERERQLRLQNESLLAVARNLFSHLGELFCFIFFVVVSFLFRSVPEARAGWLVILCSSCS